MSSPDAGIAAALRARGVAEVDASRRRLAEYSSDASLYRVWPAAVVFPRSSDEIAIVLECCRERGVPLTMRGAGTSLAGNAVGPGVVLDTSRHLRRMLRIDPAARVAVVEPGVVLDDLQRAAAVHGLRFGPDPSTHSRCTVGGMIGNNSCGSRALGYGRTADNVLALDVITGTGEALAAAVGPGEAESPTLTALADVVTAHLAVIRTELGRFARQVSGYSLEHLLPERGFDVAKALVGTEGTCAITTSARLRLVEAAHQSALVVLGYPTLAAAADAVPGLLPFKPTALEGMDSKIFELAESGWTRSVAGALPAGRGLLLVELAGHGTAELAETARRVIAASGAAASMLVEDPRVAAAIWRAREDGAGLVYRPPGARPHYAGWEDAAVPPGQLGSYLREFEALMAEYNLTGLPYGHFGDGCLHIRLDFSFADRSGRQAFRQFLQDAADLVARHDGSMSGEHGDGRARSELLPRMYSAQALAAFAAMKAVFDPDDVLNPGVVVRPRQLDADLRPVLERPVRARLGFRYSGDDGDFSSAVGRCTGVGKCRADLTAAGGVMCPSYLATRDEKDSTRGRARNLQELASGRVPGGWRAAGIAESLDLCLGCKACSADCPTGTDMATYKAEALYQRYRGRRRPAAHYSLGWLPLWAQLASRAPGLVNALLGAPVLRQLGARAAGIDQRRPLPRFARRTFRQWFAGHLSPDGNPLVLWVDTFTDHFTPEVGMAAVRVLETAGYRVALSRAGDCCGLTWISTGQLGVARRMLSRSLAGLAPHVAVGTPVVGLEPSCVAAFRGDAAELADERVAHLGARVLTLAEALAGTAGWHPPDLGGLRAVAQPHCHQHAVMGWRADAQLLGDAGVTTTRVGGCCGLAGNFGMERGHYELSKSVAETSFLPAVRAQDSNGVVLADGFSCRTQLSQLAGRRAYHLAELLAGGSRGRDLSA